MALVRVFTSQDTRMDREDFDSARTYFGDPDGASSSVWKGSSGDGGPIPAELMVLTWTW